MCTLNTPHQCAHSTTFTCRCQTPTHTPTHSYTHTRTHAHTHAHTLLHTHKHSGVDIAWRRGHCSDANRCVRSRVWAHWRVESSRHGFIIGVWGRVVMVLSLACGVESSWFYPCQSHSCVAAPRTWVSSGLTVAVRALDRTIDLSLSHGRAVAQSFCVPQGHDRTRDNLIFFLFFDLWQGAGRPNTDLRLKFRV